MSNSLNTLITGASAGIGQHIARKFASHGHNLILVARNEAALQQNAAKLRAEHGVDVTVHAADLSAPGAAANLLTALGDQQVDVLVNNAGVLTSGAFKHMSEDDIQNMLTLNIVALTALCRTFIPPMVERGSGKVLNVASVAAFQPVPSLAVYAATKTYVLSLSESLSMELAKKNVSVTALCPGYTDTNMLRGPITAGKAVIPEIAVLTPQRVAADAYQACMRGDPVKVPGIGYAALATSMRVMPKWLSRRLTAMGTGVKR